MKTIILLALVLISVNCTSQVPSYLPSNGLVGWWPFNGNANDESGNGNNGTVSDAISSTDRMGNLNQAYSFNGTSSYISVNDNSSLDISNVTISAWYLATDYGTSTQLNQGHIVSKRESSGWGSGYQLAVESSTNTNGIWATFTNGTNAWVAFTSNSILTSNNWINVIYTHDNNFAKLYINGVLLSTTIVNGGLGFNDLPLWFGARPFSGGNSSFFNGKLDDIGIWNRALSEQEILALYHGCQLNISTQPSNQSVNLSVGNTSFNVASNAANPTFQWQTNLGLGFQSLSNAGQYNGVNTANLSVSNLNLSNNNQTFRCIINDNGCVDTSNIATLTIIDDASVFEENVISITISPNPINNSFSIAGIENIASLTLKDLNGNLVKTFDIQEKNHSITNVSAGIYFLELRDDNRSHMIRLLKE